MTKFLKRMKFGIVFFFFWRLLIWLSVLAYLLIDNCEVLNVLIEEYLDAFKLVFPGSTVIPKMHFMIHYAEQILAIGPMICSWTMRQEANFKRASHLWNFKNIACTLACRHQRWICYQSASGFLIDSPCECGPGSLPRDI